MLIKLKVHPDAKESSCLKKSQDSYEIWVRAPAKNGLANQAALRELAQALRQDLRRLRIVKGAHSSHKIVQIYTPT